MRVLPRFDAHPQLFQAYARLLSELQSQHSCEKSLRLFEKTLLEELGYGVLPKSTISLHNTILPDKYYRFTHEQGFVFSEFGEHLSSKASVFLGKNLLAFAQENWQDDESLQDAKRLIRLILTPLLGSKLIYSRRLFMQPEEEKILEK